MNTAEAEEFTQALGQVVAGGWRLVAQGQRLGVPKALGLSTTEWVEGRLGGYIRLGIAERRGAVAELTEEGVSGRGIANVLGVDEGTVRGDKEATAENSALADPTVSADAAENGAPAENSAPDDELAEHRAEAAAASYAPVQLARLRKTFYRAAESTAKLMVEFEALVSGLSGEHRESAQATARDATDTWARIARELTNPKLRRAK